MAKLSTETLTINLSRLVKNNEEPQTSISEDLIQSLEQVAQELVGQQVVVEISIED